MDKNSAIETLKSFVENTDNIVAKDAILTLHPELAESEDERNEKIRKHLISSFNYEMSKYGNVEWEKGISYREVIAYLEKQKEQKPAEWSEEDKRKLNRIYEILGHAADDKGFLTSKRIIGDKEAIELQDFLRSIVKLKQDWSEEDKDILNNIIVELEVLKRQFGECYFPAYDRLINWLKSLRLQPHWKPSEEQIGMLRAVLNDNDNITSEAANIALKSLCNDLEKL